MMRFASNFQAEAELPGILACCKCPDFMLGRVQVTRAVHIGTVAPSAACNRHIIT